MAKIHFISAEKGGVGKTHVASLLAEEHIRRGSRFVAFDGDLLSPVFSRRYKARPEVRLLDLREKNSADSILEAAMEGSDVIVDLPAASTRDLAAWQSESGFAESAAEEGVHVIYWHVIDGDPRTQIPMAAALKRLAEVPDTLHIVARNEGRTKDFVAYDGDGGRPSEAKLLAGQLGAIEITIPALNGEVARKLSEEDLGFSARIALARTDFRALKVLEAKRVQLHLEHGLAEIARAIEAIDNTIHRRSSLNAAVSASA